jgi:hypothetical protein
MFRRVVPLAIALALVVGCNNKSDDSGGGGGGEPAPSGPPVTIKIRQEQQGDSFAVSESKALTVSNSASGPKGQVSKSKAATEKAEYVETVVQMPAGSDRPTKVTREYRVAEKSEDGEPAKSMSYAKKTLVIEKKGSGYTYTVNGTALPQNEAKEFRDAYEKPDKLKREDFLPKKAVQVNEKWSLDPSVLKKMGTDFKLPVSAEKSSGTGRLTKTYSKNGQQWGTIEIRIDLVVDETKQGQTLTGTLGMTVTSDTAIDGSSLDGTTKTRITGKIKQAAAGVERERQIDGEGEETRTTVK